MRAGYFFPRGRGVTELPFSWCTLHHCWKSIQNVAKAVAVLDETGADARSTLGAHGWAAPEPSVLSFSEGEPAELVIV